MYLKNIPEKLGIIYYMNCLRYIICLESYEVKLVRKKIDSKKTHTKCKKTSIIADLKEKYSIVWSVLTDSNTCIWQVLSVRING